MRPKSAEVGTPPTPYAMLGAAVMRASACGQRRRASMKANVRKRTERAKASALACLPGNSSTRTQDEVNPKP
jgi:hypothetical protein